MSDQPTDNNLHPYRRQQIEPEIAAMGVKIDDDDNPTLIVNIDDPSAKSAVKKVIVLVGVAFSGLAEWLSHHVRRHPAAAMAGTAAVATLVTAVATGPLRNGEMPDRPPASRQTITVPAVTITTTKSPAPSQSASRPPPSVASPAQRTQEPRRDVRPSPRPSPRPTRARTPPPKSPTVPAPSTDAPSMRPLRSPTFSDPEPTEPAAELTTDTSIPEPEPSASSPPDLAPAGGCGGLLHVDVDPLLDVCVL